MEKDAIKKTIDKLITYVRDLINPQKIILFGSYAYGKPDKDSDIDLLIVKEIEKETQRKEFRNILRRQIPPLGVGKDFIIVSPQELESYKDIMGTVIYPAVHRGKVVYEKRD